MEETEKHSEDLSTADDMTTPPADESHAPTPSTQEGPADAQTSQPQAPEAVVPAGEPDATQMPEFPAQEPSPQMADAPSASTAVEAPQKTGGSSQRSAVIVGVVSAIVALVIGIFIGMGINPSPTGSVAPATSTPSGAQAVPEESEISEETVQPQEPEIEPVDKSGLEALYGQYSAVSGDGYTPESFAKFKDALGEAAAAISDPNATQAEVDSAENALTAAHSGLVEVFDPASYEWVSYTDVARNPDSYAGKKLAFTGRVLQVIDGTSETDIRLATDGEYDDVVFVGYAPDIIDFRVLDDDNITVYGTCIGLYTYESTMGASISIPGLYATHIELNSQ